MRKFWFIAIVPGLLSAVSVSAQTGQLTIDEAVTGQYSKFYPASLQGLTLHPDSQICLFTSRANEIHSLNVQTLHEDSVLTLATLNAGLKKLGQREYRRLPAYNLLCPGRLMLQGADRITEWDLKAQKPVFNLICDSLAANQDFSDVIRAFAFTRGNNLFIKYADGHEQAVTTDNNDNIVNGQIVSRNEFGIEKGTFWSPGGNFLAFYRKDESHVTSYPIVDIETRIATVRPVKYPMAGMQSERVSLGVYNLKTGKTVFLEQDTASEKYLTAITWSPDEKYIYIALLNRGQDSLLLNRYDAQSGKLANHLFSETNPRYVEPLNPLYFPTSDPDQLIWLSQRDGYAHLYLYQSSGKLIRQLTSGNWIVTDVLGFDKTGSFVYVLTTFGSPLNRQLARVQISSGKMEMLTSASGTHHPMVAPSGWFVDIFESTMVPRKITAFNASGKKINDLLVASNPYANYKMGRMTIGTLLSADRKTILYYRCITPPDFDSTRRYPVVVYVYGGPHTQLITNRWLGGASLWDYYMAQKGYVMFTLDNRGSSGRGFEFESAIHRQLGKLEMEDQMQGVDWLKKQAWIDTSRIGVHGWSYGGFMTLSLMTHYPEIFKVGVAGGPVTDWKYYEVMYGERYMDRPQENTEGYANSSVLDKTRNLKGKLLIIHGAQDATVVWQQSLAFIQECIENRKQVDYFVYPLHEHNVRGLDRIHLMQKITDYFEAGLH